MIGGLNQFRVLFFQIRNKFSMIFHDFTKCMGHGMNRPATDCAKHVAACDVIVLPLICRVDPINKVEYCTRKHISGISNSGRFPKPWLSMFRIISFRIIWVGYPPFRTPCMGVFHLMV